MARCMLNISYKDRKTTTIWVRERKQFIDIISNVRKYEMVLGWAHQPHQRRMSPLVDHMARKDDKEDQPSGGETTWTNTGTRSDRGQHKIR